MNNSTIPFITRSIDFIDTSLSTPQRCRVSIVNVTDATGPSNSIHDTFPAVIIKNPYISPVRKDELQGTHLFREIILAPFPNRNITKRG